MDFISGVRLRDDVGAGIRGLDVSAVFDEGSCYSGLVEFLRHEDVAEWGGPLKADEVMAMYL